MSKSKAAAAAMQAKARLKRSPRKNRKDFLFPMVRLSRKGPTFAQLSVVPMQIPSSGVRPAMVAVAGFLALSAPSVAHQLFPPAVRRATVPQSRPAPVPSPRAASCHNGASFEKFLSELKQRALGEGVSHRAVLEASPYLVY